MLLMVAVEEEFAVDIPENEANKISTTAHLIDYLATPSISQMRLSLLPGQILLTSIGMFLSINMVSVDDI